MYRMNKKVIVPDFSPRKHTPQAPIVTVGATQSPGAFPEKILISESQKLPYVAPPPPPAPVIRHVPPPAAPKYVTLENTRGTPLTTSAFSGPTQNSASASFSPNLETFAGINAPYFATLADLPDIAQWSLYPAISTINMAGNNIINVNEIYASTINSYSTVTAVLDLDGNNLTTAGDELLFNGQPLATVSTATSSITGWSLYPAISAILADNNAITGVTDIQLSSINGSPYLSSFNSEFISTATSDLNMSSFAVYTSSILGLSSINGAAYPPPIPSSQWISTAASDLNMSSFALYTSSILGLSSINGAAYPPPIPSSQWISTAASQLNMANFPITNVSSINGAAFPGPVADVSQWANFPASSTVQINDKYLSMTTTTPGIAYLDANINANLNVGTLSNAPLRPNANFYVGSMNIGSVVSPLTNMNVESIGGITVNSLTGVAITGGGGVAITGGGAVAVTGLGGVAVSGGGAVSVNGTGGVSVVGSGAVSVAAGGVLVSGGGVAVVAGGVNITAGGLVVGAGELAVGAVGLAGGGVGVYGSDLKMTPVGAIPSQIYTNYIRSQSGTDTMQITNVSTINNAPYPPTAVTVIPFSYNIYVSNVSGSDTTGDGKISNPYQTITKAITVAGTIPELNQVIINLACGNYKENLTISRANLYITGGATSLSTATYINGSITIDTTVSAQFVLVGGLSSVLVNNIIYNNSVAKDQSYVITDCVITPVAGVSAIVVTDTSVGGNGSMTVQNSLIYMSDTTAVTISNGRISMINTQITNNPVLANATVSLLTTSGSGGVNLFGCSVIQNSTASTVQPLINMTNNAATGAPMLINSCILQYTSATLDTGTGAKCCIRFSNSAAISGVSVINNLLICEGARTTNGTPTQYLAIQRTGAGTITLSYGQNICGATANHLPATAAGLTKTAYVVLGN